MVKDNKSINDRPMFLKIMCILGFIYTSISILWYAVISSLFYLVKLTCPEFFNNLGLHGSKSDEISSLTFNNTINDMFKFIEYYLSHADIISIFFTGLSLASLWGVFLMWKLKQYGFYIFSVSQVIMMLLPFILYGITFITIITLIFTGILSILFIVLFFMSLRIT
jgi:hypothetical protein